MSIAPEKLAEIVELVRRLEQIRDHDWRVSMLAHTSDTAGEAAAFITALTCSRSTDRPYLQGD